MDRIPRSLLILLAVLALLSFRQWSHRDITHPAGVLVSRQPVQTAIESGPLMTQGEFQLQRRAQFDVQARVLSTERYYLGHEADLSPLDLALGWGPMSDQAVVDKINITQGNRWYFTSYELPAPLPPADVIRNSGNMHMIPAEPWIKDELLALRPGDVVELSGFLVDVQDSAGFTWRTSLTREDTGGGSCELLWVTDIRRAPRP